jgi:acyl-CoA thioester hydrolase
MGVAHHSVFPVWFEMGRTELLRETGLAYRDLEAQGVFLAVVSLEVKYKAPARYDDQLVLETELHRSGPVRLEHRYRLLREQLLLATAATTLACLDRKGKLQPIPQWLLGEPA